MFLQQYNPWGKMKREQLQSWNILSFDPKKTDVDEHIDLINALGDMVDQKEEAKMEKFIETMPTMIQTHLIILKDWAEMKDKAKSLEHIIWKCDPPTPAMPLVTTGATVPGLYSHIAHSVDKDEAEIPPLFKGAKPKQTRGRGKSKGKPQGHRQNPLKDQEVDESYCYIVGLGPNCKFIDLLFKRLVITFIKINFLNCFIVSEIIYSQADTLTEELMYLR